MERPIHDAFAHVARAFEDDLITPQGFVEEDVPAHFARMEGAMKTTRYALTSRRFRGRGGACATLALMTDTDNGALTSVTASCCPPSGNGWPILGVDLVAFRKMMNLVVLDVSPLTPDTTGPANDVLGELKASFEDRLPKRKRPEFVSQTFSDHAIFCAARPEDADFVAQGAQRLIRTYAAMLEHGGSGDRSPEEQTRLDAWCAAMRTNKKELKALTTLFGDPARVYLDDFLFVFGA